MPVLENLMKRWGFVKLSRYGLVLTPEGRIISMRPAMLEAVNGDRLVGWREDDLPAIDLSSWEPPARRPAKPVAVVSRVATPTPALVPQTAPVLASEHEPPEDEWEWEIALARARVAAEETESAAARLIAPRRRSGDTVPPPIAPARAKPVVPPPVPPPRQPAAPITIVIPAKSEPIAVVAKPAPITRPMRATPNPTEMRAIAARATELSKASETARRRTVSADPVTTRAVEPRAIASETGRTRAVDPETVRTRAIDPDTVTTRAIAAKTAPIRAVATRDDTKPMSLASMSRASTTASLRAPRSSDTAPMHAVSATMRTVAAPDTTPMRALSKTMPMQTVAPEPATVIPVPALPRVEPGYRPAPVVRSARPVAPRRFATGTRPVEPKTSPGLAVDADPTAPSITLPPAASPVALPGVTPRK